ncbi:MAG: cobalamin-dependent protein [Firmicutes bacterium]|nr:cobalamin-dependent protein [Bacillota bacterium]
MNVLLVRPGRRKQAITLGEFMFSEPFGLECLYALLKDKHKVTILDLMVGEEDFVTEFMAIKPDVIGFTSLCIDVFAVLELARQTKKLKKDCITLVGGTQTYLAPASFYDESIDHVVHYTTRGNIKALFSHLEQGEHFAPIAGIHSRATDYVDTGQKGYNDYLVPDRTSTSQYRHHYSYFGYQPCAIMQTSRGCSAMCNFCLRWKIEGCQEVDEPIEDVVAQIAHIDEPNVMIFDNNFLYNQERLERFCELLEQEKIKKNFICYGSAESIVAHKDTMGRLADNGLCAVLVGYESFSEQDLQSYKKVATPQTNVMAAKILKESGIDCWASFIVNPDWDILDFKQMRRYIRQLHPQISSLSPLTPFPGSYLYHKYQNRVLFAPEDYDKWSFSLVSIQPSQMSLRRYYYEVLKTNLYVNLYLNNASYMAKKFGIKTLYHLFCGALRFLSAYIKLMLKG